MTLLRNYLKILLKNNDIEILRKYLNTPSIVRLKSIGYFCGMDYASNDIYNFDEYISRYDHSLTTALLTLKFTKDKKASLAALYHDISTPCFSHVIDYMNKDYQKQESTEAYSKKILKRDKILLEYLKDDNISLNDIDFKKYNIVDNDRPKLCADRLDGIILTSLFWTKKLNISDVSEIIDNIELYKNEDGIYEIGFKDTYVANYIIELNKHIDIFCHSKEDNYMMQLLADITKLAIDSNIIEYKDLYKLSENDLMTILNHCNNKKILNNLRKFKNIKAKDIPDVTLPDIKIRTLKPIVRGKR